MELARKILIGVVIAAVLVIINWRKIVADLSLFATDRRKWLYLKWKNWGEPILVAVVLALFIRTFFVQAFKIPTGSMRPTFMENDRILVDKLTYRFRAPRRGDIIVFKYPADKKKDFVKRLVGFGGETIEIKDGSVYVDGKKVEEPASVVANYYYNRNDWMYGQEGQKISLPENTFFVLGDNSAQSSDSRSWGFVPRGYLKGRAILIYWPPSRIRWIKQ
jgi:signal peptidase I